MSREVDRGETARATGERGKRSGSSGIQELNVRRDVGGTSI